MHPNIIVVAQRQLEDPNGLFTQSLRAKVPLPLQARCSSQATC